MFASIQPQNIQLKRKCITLSACTMLNVFTGLNILTHLCWQVRITHHCQCTLALCDLKTSKFSPSNQAYLTVQIFHQQLSAQEAVVSLHCTHPSLHATLKGNKNHERLKGTAHRKPSTDCSLLMDCGQLVNAFCIKTWHI